MRALWLALLCATAGCQSATTGTLSLSWSFADGRGCIDAGVGEVIVSVGGAALPRHMCSEGLAPAMLMLDGISDGATLAITADTIEGEAGYEGATTLDAVLSPTDVVLYATATR